MQNEQLKQHLKNLSREELEAYTEKLMVHLKKATDLKKAVKW